MKQYDKYEGIFKLVLNYCFFIVIQKLAHAFFPLERSNTVVSHSIELPPDFEGH